MSSCAEQSRQDWLAAQEGAKRRRMRSTRRESFTDPFRTSSSDPVPDTPAGGARIKVRYHGACYTDNQMKDATKRQTKGMLSTLLYPGFEVSGTVHELGRSVQGNQVAVGDKVIIYPGDEEEPDQGFNEYVVVNNVENLVKVPDSIPMEVAATLPSGALLAYNAISMLKMHVQAKILANAGKRPVHMIIGGCGPLGTWTIRMARHLLPKDPKLFYLTVADTCLQQLKGAEEKGVDDTLHWDESVYEGDLIARTKYLSEDGPDFVIDYSSPPRKVNRGLKVLGKGGVLVVAGNCPYEVPICLRTMAKKQQTIMGVSIGSREQLQTIVELVASNQISTTDVRVFPVEEANKVFQRLNSCEITERVVLEVIPS